MKPIEHVYIHQDVVGTTTPQYSRLDRKLALRCFSQDVRGNMYAREKNLALRGERTAYIMRAAYSYFNAQR